ncbi:putative Helix-turn-helix domain of transposase IS66 [Gemmata sp. SH-PL17]|nr:putative Helix-turn-helix domain of transposase IS66 [Gemmata sp. SH-PL17]
MAGFRRVPYLFSGMTPPPLPPDVFGARPPAVQAYIRYLEARLADLEARLGQNSTSSSKPPSCDPPYLKPAPSKASSGKRKGGQPGRPKRSRPDLPAGTVIALRPSACDRCANVLSGDDAQPLRHQVVELPPVRPVGTEYRRHRLACPSCGRIRCPARPAEVRGGYGPRVQAVCALQYRTATALEPIAEEARAHIAGKPANADETGWRERPQAGLAVGRGDRSRVPGPPVPRPQGAG